MRIVLLIFVLGSALWYKVMTYDCIVFVYEFIGLNSCLVGPRRYTEQ